MTSPVVAVKTLTVKAWLNIPCSQCHQTFDIERQEARMAPDAPLVVAGSEEPFAIMGDHGYYTCPHCQHQHKDEIAAIKGESSRLMKKLRKNKKVEMTLLVHPDWLKGAPGHDEQGPLGGTATSEVAATQRWSEMRASTLKLLEVRGKLPDEVTCPETGFTFSTSEGTIPKKSNFTCQEDTCGRQQDILESIRESKATGPISGLVIQGFSFRRKEGGAPYGGRFYAKFTHRDHLRYQACIEEWNRRKKGDLKGYWPESEVPYGFMTHLNNGGVHNHGFTHWYKMFNPRQLLVHSLIFKTIEESDGFSNEVKDFVVGAAQSYLTYQNLFTFWHKSHDHFAPHLSNNNYHSKNISIEVGAFSSVGYGPWRSAKLPALEGLMWKTSPWELVPNKILAYENPDLLKLTTGQSEKVYPCDPITNDVIISTGSSTELPQYEAESFDLVVTDPPFGGLLHYSELADFLYVWLRLTLKNRYPQIFGNEFSPKTLEAVSNKARHPEDPDAFYKRLLTECWREANRLLKPSGILTFTFHHSEDDPWVDVLESLFDAGYYLEATYPIRSDETKGQGSKPGTIGSQKIEYDILHVCRKRIETPQKISWARLRRQILTDVRQLQSILEHHHNEGLPKADIQVIKRGKALEYFSRHYGQVYVEEGREFTVKEALVGINQLLDDQSEGGSSTPVKCEPISRQFLRIFHNTLEVPRDQMQKYLRGTGIGPSDFISRGWTQEKRKVFNWVPPLEFAQERVAKFHNLHRDLDQAMVLVGACFADSGINVKKLLNSDFKPHPALGDLLNWWVANGGSSEMRNAAITARQLYNSWAANNQQIVQQQFALFDME